jgi:hypothetical protein
MAGNRKRGLADPEAPGHRPGMEAITGLIYEAMNT